MRIVKTKTMSVLQEVKQAPRNHRVYHGRLAEGDGPPVRLVINERRLNRVSKPPDCRVVAHAAYVTPRWRPSVRVKSSGRSSAWTRS